MENTSAIKIEDLSYKYLSSSRLDQDSSTFKEVLDKISFKISEGEKVSIIGPNGAGKSTLLLNIAGLADEKYREGEIYMIRSWTGKAYMIYVKISDLSSRTRMTSYFLPGYLMMSLSAW